MLEITPITQSLVYELTRQNQGILSELKVADKTITQLKSEQYVMKNGYHKLLLRLKKANEKIHELTINLADDHSEIS